VDVMGWPADGYIYIYIYIYPKWQSTVLLQH